MRRDKFYEIYNIRLSDIRFYSDASLYKHET